MQRKSFKSLRRGQKQISARMVNDLQRSVEAQSRTSYGRGISTSSSSMGDMVNVPNPGFWGKVTFVGTGTPTPLSFQEQLEQPNGTLIAFSPEGRVGYAANDPANPNSATQPQGNWPAYDLTGATHKVGDIVRLIPAKGGEYYEVLYGPPPPDIDIGGGGNVPCCCPKCKPQSGTFPAQFIITNPNFCIWKSDVQLCGSPTVNCQWNDFCQTAIMALNVASDALTLTLQTIDGQITYTYPSLTNLLTAGKGIFVLQNQPGNVCGGSGAPATLTLTPGPSNCGACMGCDNPPAAPKITITGIGGLNYNKTFPLVAGGAPAGGLPVPCPASGATPISAQPLGNLIFIPGAVAQGIAFYWACCGGKFLLLYNSPAVAPPLIIVGPDASSSCAPFNMLYKSVGLGINQPNPALGGPPNANITVTN